MLGQPLMPWQRHVADVALEVNASDQLVYREVVLTVPRQSGKTTLLLSTMVQRALGFGVAQRVTYTAQTRNDARLKLVDEHLPLLDGSPFKGRYTPRLANGGEAIKWHNGSMQGLTATTKKSGHGATLDLGVIDEAFAQPDARLEQSMKPAMVTRPSPQLWVVSTAGDEDSVYLWDKVRAGRQRCEQHKQSRVAYFEWSAGPEIEDPLDPATWPLFMPALGHTIGIEAVKADLETMDRDEFLRAYCNRWVRKDGTQEALPGWADCADANAQVRGPVGFAVDVSPDQLSAAIVACGRGLDGAYHVEVVKHDLGTRWVVDDLVTLRGTHEHVGIGIVPSAPAGALLPDLAAAGIPVVEVSTGDVARACGKLYDAVKNRGVTHLAQPPLDVAVDGAVRRKYGDGGWLWSRATSSTDISPLCAATVALWVFAESEAPEPPPAQIRAFWS
jgi:hypothetical protein